MFKNRFTLIAAVLFVLIVSLAVSRPFSNAPKSADLSSPPRAVIVPAAGAEEFSDYYERHRDLGAPASGTIPVTRSSAADAPLDECIDVSIEELAACRQAAQTPVLTPGLACESPVDCR